MKPKNTIRALGLSTAALLLVVAQPGAAVAQNGDKHQHDGGGHQAESKSGHSHAMAELHSGSVTMTPNHHFEVVTTDNEIRLYAYDKKQNPISSLKNVKASVTLEVRGGNGKTLNMAYVAPSPDEGRVQGHFAVQHDFAKVVEGSMKATFRIEGMEKKPITFKSSVSPTEAAMYACPMHADMTAEDPGECPKCGMQMKMGEMGKMGKMMHEKGKMMHEKNADEGHGHDGH